MCLINYVRISKSKKINIWHGMDADSVVSELGTSVQHGLTTDEVKIRRNKYGKNKLPDSKKRSAFIRFLSQINHVLMLLLIAAAVVTALMGHWIDTAVIFAVVLINAIVGFIQEGKAEETIESIRKMLTLQAKVIRESKRQTIDAEDLVPGDIVILKSGDKIPADARIFEVKDFKLEEAPLTGESTDIRKTLELVGVGKKIESKKNIPKF